MKNVEYYKPQDPSELQELMQAKKACAVLIAGGTNLIHQMRSGEKEPEVLVDISELEDLIGIKTEDNYITIGAATSIAEIAAMSSTRTTKVFSLLYRSRRICLNNS